MPSYDRSILQIRFIGDSLDRHAVPIYELGVALVAIQRMIHKAYLVERGQEKARPYLSFDERQRLALQLVGRKKASDGYGLGAILSDPIIAGYTVWLLQSLTEYVKKRVTGKKGEGEGDTHIHIYTGVVYNQVADLAGRIGNIGGVKEIELVSPHFEDAKPVIIDSSTKNYVNAIKDDVAYGAIQEIEGIVLDLIPGETSVKAKIGNRIVKILLDQADFDSLRYHTGTHPRVSFLVEPAYKLGREVYAFEHFEAQRITILNDGKRAD